MLVPPSLRIVLVLHDTEELDTREVARILGSQEGTVRVRLHCARLVVRKEMANLLPGSTHRLRSPATADEKTETKRSQMWSPYAVLSGGAWLRFDTNVVVHGSTNPLLAFE